MRPRAFPASSWDALEADDEHRGGGRPSGWVRRDRHQRRGAPRVSPIRRCSTSRCDGPSRHAIDRAAVIEDLWFGLASPLETMSPSADPKWLPEIPEEDRFDYDPDLANQILDDAGYMDTDGDGIREMPDGTNPIVIRHAVNTDGDLAGSIGDLMVGWMEEIGIGVTLESYARMPSSVCSSTGPTTPSIGAGCPSSTPTRCSSYFTEAEMGNYNDANWFDPAYDALYTEQNQEVDPEPESRDRPRDAHHFPRRRRLHPDVSSRPTSRPIEPTPSRAGSSSPPRSAR